MGGDARQSDDVLKVTMRTMAAPVGDVIQRLTSELRQAFTVAGVSSVPRLGKRLARLAGCPVAGFVVTRIGRDAGGAVWSILPS